MKSKIAFLFFCVVLFVASCKKETVPAIAGKWMNTSVYTDNFGWETVDRFHEFITFQTDARFSVFTDMPASSGTYTFDNSTKTLVLHFDADSYSNVSRREIRQVETMTEDKLIVAFVSTTDGVTYKTEYTRIN